MGLKEVIWFAISDTCIVNYLILDKGGWIESRDHEWSLGARNDSVGKEEVGSGIGDLGGAMGWVAVPSL